MEYACIHLSRRMSRITSVVTAKPVIPKKVSVSIRRAVMSLKVIGTSTRLMTRITKTNRTASTNISIIHAQNRYPDDIFSSQQEVVRRESVSLRTPKGRMRRSVATVSFALEDRFTQNGVSAKFNAPGLLAAELDQNATSEAVRVKLPAFVEERIGDLLPTCGNQNRVSDVWRRD